MRYIGNMYRPPSEADSLLIQVTLGCAWNKCTFCTMYSEKPFRMRKLEDVKRDLAECAPHAAYYKRIFLCDGNALVLPQEYLEDVLQTIRTLFPNLQDVRAYASSKDILRKSEEQLKRLAQLGLGMVFTGLESGSDKVLTAVRKGESREDMQNASKMLHKAGIKQSISIISGLGGPQHWQEHMLQTAQALNVMQPQYLGLLALTPPSAMGYPDETEGGPLQGPSELQQLQELKLLLENLQLKDCLFSSAHVSNTYHVRGQLPQDKARLLQLSGQLLADAQRRPNSRSVFVPKGL